VRHLVESGDTVAILLRPVSDPWRIVDVLDRVETISGQLSEPDALSGPLAGFRPDVVYHLGWSGSGHAGRNDPAQQSANVPEAVALVELASDAGATAWIGLGSQAENGPTAAVLDESTPVRPTTAYGAAKLSAGALTRERCAARSVRQVWLRLLTAYGPAEDPSYLIPQVILSLLRGGRPALTEGNQPSDFLHAADASRALRAAALNESCTGTFVLSSGHHRPVREIALALRDLIDPRLELGFGEIIPRDPPLGLRGNPRALELATGWSPNVSLPSGLAGCVDWYRRNLSRYAAEQA
jgi:nucleoside-diphosphate-sugar epimerase